MEMASESLRWASTFLLFCCPGDSDVQPELGAAYLEAGQWFAQRSRPNGHTPGRPRVTVSLAKSSQFILVLASLKGKTIQSVHYDLPVSLSRYSDHLG